MYKQLTASVLALTLFSSSFVMAQTTSPGATKQQSSPDEPSTFLGKVKTYFMFAHLGLALSFKHKFGENSIAGNDRIIFAANYDIEDAWDEGRDLGGTVLGAIAQCEAGKSLYEKHYREGICDQIKMYAPKTHEFENVVWESTLKYVIAPMALATAVTVGLSAFCVHKKLKRA